MLLSIKAEKYFRPQSGDSWLEYIFSMESGQPKLSAKLSENKHVDTAKQFIIERKKGPYKE